VSAQESSVSIAPEAFPTLYSFAQTERVVANSRINTIRGHEQRVFEHAEPDSDERLLQFELITDDLACTKARIGLNQADTVLTIEFATPSALALMSVDRHTAERAAGSTVHVHIASGASLAVSARRVSALIAASIC
jgi:hypothetical protein